MNFLKTNESNYYFVEYRLSQLNEIQRYVNKFTWFTETSDIDWIKTDLNKEITRLENIKDNILCNTNAKQLYKRAYQTTMTELEYYRRVKVFDKCMNSYGHVKQNNFQSLPEFEKYKQDIEAYLHHPVFTIKRNE